jgi:hypothetical protein
MDKIQFANYNYERNPIYNKLAIELVSQAYATNNSSESLKYSKTLDSIISDNNQMIKIALHLSQATHTGYYSILFNKVFRNIKELSQIKNLSEWTIEDYFPELYDNDKLTPTEKNKLKENHIREYNALCAAFQKALTLENPKFFRHPEDYDLPDNNMDDLYSQCYNQICIIENLNATQSFKDASQSTYSSPIATQIFVDFSPFSKKLSTYYLSTKDLLTAILKDQKNPLTGNPFSWITIEKIKNNFPTEIKLIEYTLTEDH